MENVYLFPWFRSLKWGGVPGAVQFKRPTVNKSVNNFRMRELAVRILGPAVNNLDKDFDALFNNRCPKSLPFLLRTAWLE